MHRPVRGLPVLARVLVTMGLLAAASPARSQEQGASKLHLLVRGLTTTPRVLLLGVHPGDEDANLIAWLSRGRSIETAYLSLTRGEAGQNVVGEELGTALGVVHTQEELAARRIDGAALFFSRAFDFGSSRNANDTFNHWDHEGLLGDIVAVIRSFRPHVIVVSSSGILPGSDGQQEALGILAREAFDAAEDSARFSVVGFGHAWQPLKLYGAGRGVVIDPNEFDIVVGKSPADVALESRSQSRVSGVSSTSASRNHTVLLRIATRVNDRTTPTEERSLFDGIDTSFARLTRTTIASMSSMLMGFAAFADSARATLNLARPSGVVPYLAQAVQLSTELRKQLPGCARPSADASARIAVAASCDQAMLDLDASLDLVSQRATDALLSAAGVVLEANADREFVAEGDVAAASVIVRNHGTEPVALLDVAISGSPYTPMEAVPIAPGSGARVTRPVVGKSVPFSRPWWFGKREVGLFPKSESAIDGLARPSDVAQSVRRVPSVAVPEGLRRTTDASVEIRVGGTTVRKNLGPILYHHADPILGLQDRPLTGAPAISLAFDQALVWIQARKRIDTQLQLTARSLSDGNQTFKLRVVVPRGTRADSFPAPVTLQPHEQRELLINFRGALDAGRYEFGAIGESLSGDYFIEGMRTTRYPHIAPLHFFRGSGVWLQAVDIRVPPNLLIAYITGAGSDAAIPPSLRQIGIFTMAVTPEEFSVLDLSRFQTVVVGSRAYAVHPDLIGQSARLHEFARKGGTVVVLDQEGDISQALPYPVSLAAPYPERVGSADAPVSIVAPRARVLTWPNTIGPNDWEGWVQDRAVAVPSTADQRYSSVIETNDKGESLNRNTLLVASVGKGTYIYSSLTLFRQIAGGVPGSLRLLVNLLSAGLRPSTP